MKDRIAGANIGRSLIALIVHGKGPAGLADRKIEFEPKRSKSRKVGSGGRKTSAGSTGSSSSSSSTDIDHNISSSSSKTQCGNCNQFFVNIARHKSCKPRYKKTASTLPTVPEVHDVPEGEGAADDEVPGHEDDTEMTEATEPRRKKRTGSVQSPVAVDRHTVIKGRQATATAARFNKDRVERFSFTETSAFVFAAPQPSRARVHPAPSRGAPRTSAPVAHAERTSHESMTVRRSARNHSRADSGKHQPEAPFCGRSLHPSTTVSSPSEEQQSRPQRGGRKSSAQTV